MAIVQISRITHRQGRREDLPQLSGGELGWALDTRQLFIGNGSIDAGAPAIGNTEILTEYSNIFSTYAYTYKGLENIDVDTSVPRNLQDKLDDFVSVRDFGAQGRDGSMLDDGIAIQTAINAVFKLPVAGRRILYFPAGTYYISAPLVIPSNAILIGEGDGSSIIKFNATASGQRGVFEIANDATNVVITQLGIHGPTDFVPGAIPEAAIPPDFAGVRIAQRDSGNYVPSNNKNIAISRCDFNNIRFGVFAESTIVGLTVDHCQFNNIERAVIVKPASGITTAKAVKISNNLFNSVFYEGVRFDFRVTKSITENNIFMDVGNHFQTAPQTYCITFMDSNNVSSNDMFERSEIDNLNVRRVYLGNNYGIENGRKVSLGSHNHELGGRLDLTILSASANPNTLFIVPTSKASGFIVNYNFVDGTTVRHGTLTVTNVPGTTDCQWNDDYSTNHQTVGAGDLRLSAESNALDTEIIVKFNNKATGFFNYSLTYLG